MKITNFFFSNKNYSSCYLPSPHSIKKTDILLTNIEIRGIVSQNVPLGFSVSQYLILD